MSYEEFKAMEKSILKVFNYYKIHINDREDYMQDFYIHYQEKILPKWDESKGKLNTYTIFSLKNWLVSRLRSDKREREILGEPEEQLDDTNAEEQGTYLSEIARDASEEYILNCMGFTWKEIQSLCNIGKDALQEKLKEGRVKYQGEEDV